MYVFSSVIMVVFAVIGIVALVREICLRLFSPKEKSTVIIVTPVSKTDEPEFVLRGALSRLRWGGKCRDVSVCLNMPLNSASKKICRSVCEEYGFGGLITRDETMKIIEQSSNKTC